MKNNCINLDLIYKDPNLKRLIHFGVNIGAVKHITYDIMNGSNVESGPEERNVQCRIEQGGIVHLDYFELRMV